MPPQRKQALLDARTWGYEFQGRVRAVLSCSAFLMFPGNQQVHMSSQWRFRGHAHTAPSWGNAVKLREMGT